jgi:hypothetical protein
MKVVKFTEHAPPYFGGDVAGFPDHQAADLIARGIAYEHNVDKESEPAPEAQGELLEQVNSEEIVEASEVVEAGEDAGSVEGEPTANGEEPTAAKPRRRRG